MGKRDLIRKANQKALEEKKQEQPLETTTIVDDLVKKAVENQEKETIEATEKNKTSEESSLSATSTKEKRNISEEISNFMASRPGVGKPKIYNKRKAMNLLLEKELYEYVMEKGKAEFGSGTGYIAYLVAKDMAENGQKLV